MIIKNIAIIGGGSSGWLAAAYLTNKFKHINITLVDKEKPTPVGVGEGTLLNFEYFLQLCGFQLKDWFDEIDATLKSGILFPGWGSRKNSVWHPFGFNHRFDEYCNRKIDFKNDVLKLYKSSIEDKKVELNKINDYAYHVDCLKLVNFLKDKITNRKNFKVIYSNVEEINRNELKYIKDIRLKSNQKIEADLFIDCTGFLSLLNNRNDKLNLSERLICDTAIASHIMYKDKQKELNPYVVSEAVECGWIWNIPTQQRIGSGIVFNKSITSEEEALQIFNKYWNGRLTKTKVIDWTPYFYKNVWHENVVHIGLSAGFIEPLESTGLALAMEGITILGRLIDPQHYSSNIEKLYNSMMLNYFENSIDFINMHYLNNNRPEIFWRIVNQKLKPSNKYFKILDILSDKNISLDAATQYDSSLNYDIFNNYNWFCWLIQLGHNPSFRNV